MLYRHDRHGGEKEESSVHGGDKAKAKLSTGQSRI
jgi:hypothetical protein